MPLPRLRQVALVATRLAPVAEQLESELGLVHPYRDPGVGEFGLENVVYAIGHTFLEVVAPVRPGTTAGRYLEKRGRDGGYMALFQIDDTAAARDRVRDLGIRIVWQADLEGISGTHLHPRDVGGGIISLDSCDPPDSWRWAGPAWTGGAPPHHGDGFTGLTDLTVESPDPDSLARRWAGALGIAADGAALHLDGGGQQVRFVESDREGIVEVEAALAGPPRRCRIGATSIVIDQERVGT